MVGLYKLNTDQRSLPRQQVPAEIGPMLTMTLELTNW